MDGEVCRAECAPAAAAEGHHVGAAGTWGTYSWCLSQEHTCQLEPPVLGLGLALPLDFFICFVFSLRQTFVS